MATPAEITMGNFNGVWVLSKTLSDDVEPVLALQGVGWIKRKAIGLATITLNISETVVDGKTHIDILSTGTGGLSSTTENRVLDWEKRPHEDHVFGSLITQNKWQDNKGADWDALDDFLKESWLDERVGPNGEPHMVGFVVNDVNGWTGTQVWGFSEINGLRYYTRRVIITKGEESLKVRLFYDWQGPSA